MTMLNPTATESTNRFQIFWRSLTAFAEALDFDRHEALELQVARLEVKVQKLENGAFAAEQ